MSTAKAAKVEAVALTTAEAVCARGLALDERVSICNVEYGNWSHFVTIAKTLKACRLTMEVEYVDEDTLRVFGAYRRET
jgi:hypothetical protein